MTDLTQLTPTELNKLTKDQLIAIIVEGQAYSDVNLVKDKYGNNVQMRVKELNPYGKVIEEKVIRWTYYGDGSTGEVKDIITEDGKVRDTVNHPLDGKQPTLKRVPIAKPIGEP